MRGPFMPWPTCTTSGETTRTASRHCRRRSPRATMGYFRNHLLWHLALMHLAHGGYDRVRQMFESVFGGIPIDVASDLQDSVSLAWRLDLYGHPDPARWQRLGAAARRWLELPLLLFHDVHVGMALAASSDWQAAESH